MLVLDGDFDVVFATDAMQRILDGHRGDAALRLQMRALAQQATAGGRSTQERIRVFEPDHRSLSVRVDPLAPETGGGATVYVSDVTESERLDAMRADFVTNVGHELKTPVGALAVLAEALEHAGDAETRGRLTSRLIAEARRVGALVDDVMELALVESGQRVPEVVDLAEVIREAVGRVEIIAE